MKIIENFLDNLLGRLFKNKKNKNNTIKIVPAILEYDFIEVENYLEKYKSMSTKVQIDVCDGEYVKNKTWIPNADDRINGLDTDLEFDMMCSKENLELFLKDIFLYDAKYIVIHVASMSDLEYVNFYKKIKEKNSLIKVGMGINHFDDVDRVKNNLEYIDYVQVMGIKNIGVQHEPFDESCLYKIKEIKNILDSDNLDSEIKNLNKKSFKKYIQVDGSMNPETIKLCHTAGATSFAIGSYLKESKDKKSVISKLLKV
jgi:ribulose-phosphate 3-epimerase